jgi:5'-nucleotidase
LNLGLGLDLEPEYRAKVRFGIVCLLLVACATPEATPSSPPPPVIPPGPAHARILAFNDFHGYLTGPTDGVYTKEGEVPAGGIAYLATHLKKAREGAASTITVAAGDLIGASPLMPALFHDEPVIEAMDLAGLDLLGVGNHEFDEGLTELLRVKNGGCHPIDGCKGSQPYAGAKFDILAANVRKSGETATIFPPYAIKELDGVPVAFIGMTLEDTPGVAPPTIADLRFSDEADTANALVSEIKGKGVEAIVVIVHEGGIPKGGTYDSCENLSGTIVDLVGRLDPAIDLVITGHTHQAYNCKIGERVVTSAGCYGRLYTQIDVELDREKRDFVKVEAHNHIVSHDVAPDLEVTELISRYQKLAAPIANRVVAKITGEISKRTSDSGESSLGNLIADAQLEASAPKDKGGAVVAFMNSGGIRIGLDYLKSGDEPEDGLVTYGELFAVQPFGNTIVTVTLTGAQILEFLEDQWEHGSSPRFSQVSSSFAYTWDPQGKDGAHVDPKSVRIAGKPLDKAARYRVSVNSFMAQRGVLKRGLDLYNGPPDIEVFEGYLSKRSPFAPPALGRIKKK